MPTKQQTTKKAASGRKKAVPKKAAPKKAATASRVAKKGTKRAAVTRGPRREPGRATGAAKKGSPSRERSSGPATGDAIAVLKQDHREVEQLFRRFEKAGDDAARDKRQLVDSMIEELSRHAEIEELVFYPAVRRDVDDAESDVLEALEEHHVVKLVLRELEDLDASDERFDAKVTVMMESVRHHVKEEEQELFPEARQGLGRRRMREIGDELRQAKGNASTRPNPDAGDEPPTNTLLESAAAVLERARTVGQRAVERLREEPSSS
jgi:hemerythrin-like domain-containing protein